MNGEDVIYVRVDFEGEDIPLIYPVALNGRKVAGASIGDATGTVAAVGRTVELRAVPGFAGYYAGSDGRLYRESMGHDRRGTGKLYATATAEGEPVTKPVAWFVARAWCDGYEGTGRMPIHVNGDYRDTRPANLEWPRRGYPLTKAALEAFPEHPSHGKTSGYNAGCRCQKCMAAARISWKKTQVRRVLRGEEPYGKRD